MIFQNTRNYSYLLKKDCSVVITGDSLAYNRYDFIDDSRMNAYDCPLGMKSWSFLLRDYFIRSTPGWTPASSLKISGTYERLPYIANLPFENEGTVLDFEKTTDIFIEGCPKSLFFITDPFKGALFEINGEKIELKGDIGFFEGYNLQIIDCPDGFIRNIQAGSRIILAGGANSKTDVHLTGSGSKTAEWLLENSQERILKYNPDLCLMIIGANNRRMNDPASFKGALKHLIESLKDIGSEIILISPPHSTTTDPQVGTDNVYYPNPDITKPILDATSNLAERYNLTLMDLFEFFSGTPGAIWRFDNTHFTKKGNLMLFDAIKGALFERKEI